MATTIMLSSSAPRRRVTLSVEGTNATTDIDQVTKGTCPNGKFIKAGQLYLLYEGRMYDVRGTVVKWQRTKWQNINPDKYKSIMEKYYHKPITEVVILATSPLMDMSVGSDSAPENAIGNAPKKRGGVF